MCTLNLPIARKKLPPKSLFQRIKDVPKREEKRTADILKDADFLVPNKNLMLKRVSNECSLCYGNAQRCTLPLTSHSRHHSLTRIASQEERTFKPTLLATCSSIAAISTLVSYIILCTELRTQLCQGSSKSLKELCPALLLLLSFKILTT